MEFAFGEMGLTPREYYQMTPAEFYMASKGFVTKKAREWEHTRVIAYTVASSAMGSKKLPKMEKWMPLSTDKEGNDLSDKAIKEMLAKAEKM